MLEKWLHLHRKLRMTTIIFSHLVDFVHCYTIIALDSENLPLIGRVAGEVDNCQAMLISNIQLSDLVPGRSSCTRSANGVGM